MKEFTDVEEFAKLREYASFEALKYNLPEEAIDAAMDKVADLLSTVINGKSSKIENLPAYLKAIIRNSLKHSSETRKVESISMKSVGKLVAKTLEASYDYQGDLYDNGYYNDKDEAKPGYQAVKVIDRRKHCKIPIDQIPNENERTIWRYYSDGLSQVEIAEKFDVSEAFVSQVISLWQKESKKNRAYHLFAIMKYAKEGRPELIQVSWGVCDSKGREKKRMTLEQGNKLIAEGKAVTTWGEPKRTHIIPYHNNGKTTYRSAFLT